MRAYQNQTDRICDPPNTAKGAYTETQNTRSLLVFLLANSGQSRQKNRAVGVTRKGGTKMCVMHRSLSGRESESNSF